MSIQNAMTFIKNVETNITLRKACYACQSKSDLLDMLKGEGLAFTLPEFSEAVNVMLFKCQTYEEADSVKQTELWFSLFR
jgi:predicted ribosomally synthesized peptide with nif11-like leader